MCCALLQNGNLVTINPGQSEATVTVETASAATTTGSITFGNAMSTDPLYHGASVASLSFAIVSVGKPSHSMSASF